MVKKIEKVLNLMANSDKALHFMVSMLMIATLGHLTSPLLAFSITLIVGIAKEVYDHFQPNHEASWGDLLADAVGALIGLSAIYIGLLM